ncbi:MAG: hypothetical protein WBF17_12335 [Phycisphaerae bacterium]
MRHHAGDRGPQISFARPERSPCLARFKDRSDPKYAEALAIVQAGKETLSRWPGDSDKESSR